MKKIENLWLFFLLSVALTAMPACEGVRADMKNSAPGTPIVGPSTLIDGAFPAAGVTPARLSERLAGLTFGHVQVGKTQVQTETVQNTGSSNAIISKVTVIGTGFSIAGLTTPLTLMPGQSTSFSVTFAPTFAGKFTGSMSIASDASNPILIASLSGSATGALGQLSVSPTIVNVGNVVVGSVRTQTGTISAKGGNVTVSSASSGSSEFSINGFKLPFTIAAGQNVNFTVTFTPQTSGVASVSASFTSSASNSPTPATLTGTGVAAPLRSVSLSWTDSTAPDITSYNVYRADGASCGSYTKIGDTPGFSTSYTDTSVNNGATYCYVVTAMNSSDQESAYSIAVQAVIPPL